MTPQPFFQLSADQEAHLDAWSTVYAEAHIQRTHGIPLSRFLQDPGMYLFLAWLKAPHEPLQISSGVKSGVKIGSTTKNPAQKKSSHR